MDQRKPGHSARTARHAGRRRAVAAVAVAGLLAGSSAACSSSSPRPHPTATSDPALDVDTDVTPDLGATGPLTYQVGGREYHGDQSQTVTVRARRNAAGVVAAYDAHDHQRGLAMVVHVPGVQDEPVAVTYTSTAVTELLLTPPFLTANPIAVLAVRHAALSSSHVAKLAALLRAHAARDPAYLQHPTRAELAELTGIARDVRPRPAAELRALRTRMPTPRHSITGTFAQALPAGCTPALRAYSTDDSGVCYRATEGVGSTGDVRLSATNTAASWAMLFSTAETFAPLAIVPPRKITVPTLDSLISALGSTLVQAGRAAVCKLIFGRKCTVDVLKPLRKFVSDIASDGTAKLTVPAALATKPAFDVEAAGRPGGIEEVPQSGPAATDVEVWHKTAFVLTLWSQMIGPLLSLASDQQDQTKGPPKELTTKQERKKARKELAKTVLTGPVKDALPTLINDVRAGSAGNTMKDIFSLVAAIVTTPSVLKGVIGLWGVDVDKELKKTLKKMIEKYGTDLIPGLGWVKALIELGDKAAEVANVGFGLYALAIKLPGYDTYVSYRPLRSGSSPTTVTPLPGGSTASTGSTTYPAHASAWTNKPFSIRTDRKGRVTVSWRVMRWCRDVGNKKPCDSTRGSDIIDGGVARGTLSWHTTQSATGVITSSTQPSRVPTGALTIRPAGKDAIDVTVGSTSLTAPGPTSGPMHRLCRSTYVPSLPRC